MRFCFLKMGNCFRFRFLTQLLLEFCNYFHFLLLRTQIIAWNSFCMSFIKDAKTLKAQFELIHVFLHSCEILGDKKPLNRPSKHLPLFHSLCQFSNKILLMYSEGALMFNAFFSNFFVVLRAFLTIDLH